MWERTWGSVGSRHVMIRAYRDHTSLDSWLRYGGWKKFRWDAYFNDQGSCRCYCPFGVTITLCLTVFGVRTATGCSATM